MKKPVIALLIVALATILSVQASARFRATGDPKLAHMVFFALKDHSSAAREKFIASCEKFLSGHEGSVYFSVGTRAEDVDEPVSVRDFDVALHVVFANKDAKLKYLKSSRHEQFVKANRSVFDKVRVFDSYLAK